jgi:AraC-like DNA-binding protein
MTRPSRLADERVYPPYKIAVLGRVLEEQGQPIAALLEGTDIDPAGVDRAQTRISRRQLTTAYRNAIRISRDPAIALEVGSRMRVTTYGMYGYAMMSSASLGEALAFGIKYHEMATPTVRMALDLDDDEATAIFAVEDVLGDEDLLAFNLELQLSLALSLVRDLIGDDFALAEVRASYPRPRHAERYAAHFRCPVAFDQARDELRFDEWWLRRPLLRSNPITLEVAREICDRTLRDMALGGGVARQVNEVISGDLRRYCDVESVAAELGTTSRTLRRRLADEGTTFQDLLREIRAHFAITYLRETEMKIEDIADRVGFSDAANFRHAFRRWTGKSPSEYRGARS